MFYLKVFAAVLLWDFLTTVDVRLIAAGQMWAVPLAGVFTALWFASTTWIVREPRTLPVVVLAAMVGTWLGLLI